MSPEVGFEFDCELESGLRRLLDPVVATRAPRQVRVGVRTGARRVAHGSRRGGGRLGGPGHLAGLRLMVAWPVDQLVAAARLRSIGLRLWVVDTSKPASASNAAAAAAPVSREPDRRTGGQPARGLDGDP